MNPLLLCSLHILALLFIFHHSQACHSEENSALLHFKASLTFPSSDSWNERSNCCQWHGITCDASTGHVIELDFRYRGLKGIITSNNSLFALRHLQTLRLSGNLLQSEFGVFNRLTFLRFGEATLRAMALSLKELTVLQLLSVDMSADNSLSAMANLSSSLTALTMAYCGLHGELPEEFFGNIRKLEYLSLRGNNLHGRVPWSRLNMENLSEFYLSENNFSGRIPEIYVNSSRLEYFSLKSNSFEGMIPSWIFKQQSLIQLDLSNNHFIGPIPSSIFENVKLSVLDLSFNSLGGELEMEKISKLKDLYFLSLSSNNFSLNFRSKKDLSLDSMEDLDLSYCNINFKSSINISLKNLRTLQLRSCNIEEFPTFIKSSERLEYLDLSINSIQGNVPKWFVEMGKDSLSNMGGISLSKNHFVGNIPVAFCYMSSLQLLDLSHNNFSGTIPQCITKSSTSLLVLDLRMNNLHGSVPSAFPKGSWLKTLNLNGNRIEGSLHQSLLNCKKLEVFDIGGNNISGPFPWWLESLPELQVLILRGNKFYGLIGNTKARFPFEKLRIMDLSHNEFTGSLPNKYFEKLSAMMDSHTDVLEYMGDGYYQDSVAVVMKGFEFQLEKILTIFTMIDLSSNNFEGDIPSSIGKLKSLKGLNLSHNNLVGLIPISLGNLSNIEWLDLSSNKLNGEIPNKLAEDLIQLSFLNLSFNGLVGQIPHGKQFNTFENDSYFGNLGLCGPPLSKACYEGKARQQSLKSTEHEDRYKGLDWKIVMLIGYGGGLVFGVSMGFATIHDTTIYWIMEIVNWRKSRIFEET